MKLLEDIKTFLVNNGVVVPINRDHMPDEPDTAIALYEYEGSLPSPQIAGATRPVQVVVRSKRPTEASELSYVIMKLLRTEDGILQLTEDRWSAINIRQVPFKMKTDEAGRVYYCFNSYFTTYLD